MSQWQTALAAAAGLILSTGDAAAHEVMDLDQIMQSFGWSFPATEIRTERIADDLHVLFGVGGNIAVSTGAQGVLIVDDQFPELAPKIEAAIRELGGEGVDFAINTHWHFDHADGNLAFGKSGTWLVSQSSSRRMMLDEHLINLVSYSYKQPAYPAEALPVITFDTTMQFYWNGQRIDLIHTGPAHTTGDAAVIFRGSNAVHLGDVFNNSGYPFIDADNGGDLDGMIAMCSSVLGELNPKSVVIPGHGPITDIATLAAYIEMLTVVRDRIRAQIDLGSSLAQVIATHPTAEFDERYGNPRMFVDRAYRSLTR